METEVDLQERRCEKEQGPEFMLAGKSMYVTLAPAVLSVIPSGTSTGSEKVV
jgi:hypothetical protein